MAYQGYGRKLGTKTVRAFDRIVCGTTQPDLTLALDLPSRTALERAQGRERRRNSRRGRFEAESLAFHERVRQGYLAIAQQDPRRVKVVNAEGPVGKVQAEIRGLVRESLARRGRGRKGTRD
jgi:dTMP kinase